MKGITPVIAIILLLLITIAMAGMAYISLTGTSETSTKIVGEELEQTTQQMRLQFSIENVDNNKIYIRNQGSEDLNTEFLTIYLDNTLIESDSVSISPGQVGTITLNAAQAVGISDPQKVKISSVGYSDSVRENLFKKILGYWKLNEGGGTIAIDSSGNGNDGSINNNPTPISDGYEGDALQFDRDDTDHIQADINGASVLTSFIMSAYFRTTAPDISGTVFSIRADEGSGGGSAIGIANDEITAKVTNDDTVLLTLNPATPIVFRDGNWHHIALSVNESEAKLFFDGEEIDSGTLSGPITGLTDYIRIGWGTGSAMGEFEGDIDEVKLIDTR